MHKKILGLVLACGLLMTDVMTPFAFLNLKVQEASAAACTISTDTTVDQSYIDTNSCETINVDTSSVITFSGNLDLDDAGTFTVDEGVTATLVGSGLFTDSNDSIVINGILTHGNAAAAGVNLSASGNITIGSTGSINVDAKGYAGSVGNAQASGPGGGNDGTSTNGGGGGGYGGAGGDGGGNYPGANGVKNGDYLLGYPDCSDVDFGSGGGGGSYSNTGGRGGGKVRIFTSGTFNHLGTITADGGTGVGTQQTAGGGAGGGICINADTVSGNGTFSAAGGNGLDGYSTYHGGGGGGGRIVIYYDTDSSSFDLTDTTVVPGGSVVSSGHDNEPQEGNTGVTYTFDYGSGVCPITTNTTLTAAYTGGCNGIEVLDSATLTFDGDTLDIGTGAAYDLTINSGVTATLSGTGVFGNSSDNIVINGYIAHATEDTTGIALDVAGDVTINYGGYVYANYKGYAGGTSGDDDGHGTGGGSGSTSNSNSGGGGAYGGAGGAGGNNGNYAGGSAYGSVYSPDELGSGGGVAQGYYWNSTRHANGGRGGGRIYLEVDGTLTNNGTIGALGYRGNWWGSYIAGGGGSGGSIHIHTDTLSGTGTITANGATGNPASLSVPAGGGGGGRVAVYYNTLSGFDLSNITAAGGTDGYVDGSPGSVVILDRFTDDGAGTLTMNSGTLADGDDYVRTGFATSEGSELSCDAMTTLSIGATENISFGSGTTFSCSSAITTVNLTASGNITLDNSTVTFSNATNCNLSASGFITTGDTNAMSCSKTSSTTDWNVENDMSLSNFTFTGATTNAFNMDNTISVDMTNSDINSNVNWSNIVNLTMDYLSSFNSNYKGEAGGTSSSKNGSGSGGGVGSDGTPYEGGGGGAYGGAGGASGNSGENAGGSTYGSQTNPTDYGSGGGVGRGYYLNSTRYANGGAGGGRIILDVSGSFTMNGNIYANGYRGYWWGSDIGGGGGSGGSINLTMDTFSGTGGLYANGGNGDDGGATNDGGGGGGGRIAVAYTTNSWTGTSAYWGGTGYEDGADGTYHESLGISSITITDTSGYTNDSTPVITVATVGTTSATDIAFSCDGGSNWSDWITYPDDDVVNDVDGPAFDITTGATGCSTTEELKTITAKVKNDSESPSGTVSATTTYDVTAPSGLANLAIGATTASSAIITWTAASEAVSFDHYELWYGDDQSEVQNRTGDAVEWDTVDDADLATVTTATTTLTGLSVGVTYYLKIWAIDSSTNESTLSDITFTTNQDPTAAAVTGIQDTGGDKAITIGFIADDPDDDDTLQAKVEYNVGAGWFPATLDSTATATYGTPVVDNGETYQVGQAGGYITTSSGANSITVVWDTDSDVSGVDTDSAQLRVTPYDGIAEGTASTSSTFVIDQVAPTGLGTITMSAPDSNTVGISWATGADTNFTNYKVYFKNSTDDSYTLKTTITDSSSTSYTVSGLYAGATFLAYVVATDDYGNTTTSPTGSVTTSADNPVFGQVTGGGSGGGSSSSAPPAGEAESGESDFSTPITVPTTTDASADTATPATDNGSSSGSTTDTDSGTAQDTVTPSTSTSTTSTPSTSVPTSTSTPSGDQGTEDPSGSSEPQSTSSFFSKGQVTQEVSDDEVVITFHDSDDGDDNTYRSYQPVTISLIDPDPKRTFTPVNSIVISLVPGFTTPYIDKFPRKPLILPDSPEVLIGDDDLPSSFVPDTDDEVDYEEVIENFVGQVDDVVDAIEEETGENFQTNPGNIIEDILEDKDEDGVLDVIEENTFGDTDSDGSADTDNDGLTDYEESLVGSDPFEADSDNDGLTDLVEIAIGTDPESWDSDGDGTSDTEEVFEATDPVVQDVKEVDENVYDEDTDTDGDGMSDYMEAYYETDPNNADSDGDGISDTDELAYDLDPNTADYIEDVDTEVTNIDDGTVSNSSEVTIKGTSEPESTVVVYVFNTSGSYGGGAPKTEPALVLETTTDSTGKFTTSITKELKGGNYSIFIASVDKKEKVKDVSSMTSFTVDTEKQAPTVELKEFAGSTTFGLGSKLSTDNSRPKMKAVSAPGAIVYISWKSLIFSSVVVADTQTGEFEVVPPQDLEEDDHVAYMYAEDPDTGVTGKTTQVNFSVTSDVLLHQSAAQREAEDRFPYAYLLLAGLIAIGVGYVILRRGKSDEDKMIEKL